MATMAPEIATKPSIDPVGYDEYKDNWPSLPSNEDDWIVRARHVAAILAPTAAARERENKSPHAEVALLKHAGLLKVLGPTKYGGGGQPWGVGYKVIREVAKTDG